MKIEIDGNNSLSIEHKEEIHIFHIVNNNNNNSYNNNNNNNNNLEKKITISTSPISYVGISRQIYGGKSQNFLKTFLGVLPLPLISFDLSRTYLISSSYHSQSG